MHFQIRNSILKLFKKNYLPFKQKKLNWMEHKTRFGLAHFRLNVLSVFDIEINYCTIKKRTEKSTETINSYTQENRFSEN